MLRIVVEACRRWRAKLVGCGRERFRTCGTCKASTLCSCSRTPWLDQSHCAKQFASCAQGMLHVHAHASSSRTIQPILPRMRVRGRHGCPSSPFADQQQKWVECRNSLSVPCSELPHQRKVPVACTVQKQTSEPYPAVSFVDRKKA